MKSLIIKALLWVLGGSVVFVGSLFGFLAMQGRTSAQELSRLPVLSLFVAEPPELKESPDEVEDAADDVGPDPAASGRRVEPDRRSAASGPKPAQASPARARSMAGTGDALPFSQTELERMTGELRSALQAAAQRERALDERERALERVGKDLEERRAQLERMLDELENQAADVRDERERFHREIVLLQEAEKQNLRKLADKYSVMKAEEAARVLAQLDFDDIVQIVSQMSNDRQVGKILGAMNAELAASVTEKLMKLVELPKEDR